MKKIFSIIILTAFYLNCFAQWISFTTDNGLSSGLINSINQTDDGLIWISTENGLNLYNGVNFVNFFHDENNINTPSDSYVSGVKQLSDGRIYVYTRRGLQEFNPITFEFTPYTLFLNDKLDNGVVKRTEAPVRNIIERKNGDVLICTSGHGMFLINRNDKSGHQIDVKLTTHITNDFCEDPSGNLWVATGTAGILKISASGRYKFYQPVADGQKLINAAFASTDKAGRVFIAGRKGGFHIYNAAEDRFVLISNSVSVKTILPVDNNEMFVGTDDNGLYLYRYATNEFVPYTGMMLGDLSRSKIHSLYRDFSGNIWAGVFQSGVVAALPYQNGFEYYGSKSKLQNIIGSSAVTSVCPVDSFHIAAATDGDGLYIVDTRNKTSKHYKGNVPDVIMKVFKYSDTQLLTGSYYNGAGILDIRTGKYSPLRFDTISESRYVYDFSFDNKGDLWIATMGAGLYQIEKKSHKINRFESVKDVTTFNAKTDILANAWIYSIYHTDNDELFSGTSDGICIYGIKTKSWTIHFGNTNRIAQGRQIYSIYFDGQYIWAGTGSGLLRADLDGHTQLFSHSDGLSGRMVCSILRDGEYLWLSTDCGLSKFNLKTHLFTNYYDTDGLMFNEFVKGSACRADNYLIFGGTRGVVMFDPAEIKDIKHKSDIRIADFYVNDMSVNSAFFCNNPVINKPLNLCDTFCAGSNTGLISLVLGAGDFYNPQSTEFECRLDDNPPMRLPRGVNRQSFAGLGYGTHKLLITARISGQHTSKRMLVIKLKPPFYATVAAYIVYELAAILFVTGIIVYYLRLSKLKAENLEKLRLQRINEARLDMFSSLSHEIKGPVTLVLDPINKLIKTDADGDRRKLYQLIKNNAGRILNISEKLLYTVKIDRGNVKLIFSRVEITEYLRRLSEEFVLRAIEHKIDFTYTCNSDKYYVCADISALDTIIINLIVNAFKYTPTGGKISMNLTVKPEVYIISVKDNGYGIEPDDIEKIFSKFYRSNSSAVKKGTGVGLYIVKSLSELHGGRVWAENNTDSQGATFKVMLKINPEAVNPEQLPMYQPDESPAPAEPQAEIINKSGVMYKLFIVDDDPDIGRYISETFSKNYKVYSFEDALSAYAEALRIMPDVIVSDIVMQDQDGITFCKKLKHNPETCHIPVVLLTAESTHAVNVKALNVGADAYFSKPFDSEILNACCMSLISNRREMKNAYKGRTDMSGKIELPESITADEKLLKRITMIINNHLADENLSVEYISREAGISRVHLYRKLKQLTNQTPVDFIRNMRLHTAARLLAQQGRTVGEAARMTGFQNATYFSTAFKNLIGVSPQEYLNENQAGEHR